MLFNSLTFVAFFLVVLVLHNLPFSWRAKKFNLLVASYIFYGAWNPPLVILLWISTILDWFTGRMIYRTEDPFRRRVFLVISLIGNLGMLVFFKYGGFLLENFVAAAGAYGVDYNPAAPDIILPVGISFYTFQTLTYTFDIYRKELKPCGSFIDYALYVTFFPQLVAGPIVRAIDFLPQCIEPPKVSSRMFFWGLWLMTLGLFQKVVVADGLLAEAADTAFGAAMPLHTLDAWMGVLAFSGQIFCDFAGYSTCAIGAALCLGFHLCSNFRFPYAALGFSDFWRRWHISLSTWLRDYLYIPLGGNRKGNVRTYINLMITMLLGGLWHGAAWTFVVWGGLHGLYLSAERIIKSRWGDARWVRSLGGEVFLAVLTYFFVLITWVFFRASDFPNAARMLGAMFGVIKGGAQLLPGLDLLKVSVVTIWLLVSHFMLRHTTHEELVEKMPWWLVAIGWAGMLIALILTQGAGDAFIYFQF